MKSMAMFFSLSLALAVQGMALFPIFMARSQEKKEVRNPFRLKVQEHFNGVDDSSKANMELFKNSGIPGKLVLF